MLDAFRYENHEMLDAFRYENHEMLDAFRYENRVRTTDLGGGCSSEAIFWLHLVAGSLRLDYCEWKALALGCQRLTCRLTSFEAGIYDAELLHPAHWEVVVLLSRRYGDDGSLRIARFGSGQ